MEIALITQSNSSRVPTIDGSVSRAVNTQWCTKRGPIQYSTSLYPLLFSVLVIAISMYTFCCDPSGAELINWPILLYSRYIGITLSLH